MECGAVYSFESSDQFFSELSDIISLSPNTSSLDELDYALRSYIAFASTYMDDYLTSPESLDAALQALLDSPLFLSHVDRMTSNIISLISLTNTPSTLFVALMLVLQVGLSNPLSTKANATPRTSGAGSKVFKAIRKQWIEVVPVLMSSVEKAGVMKAELSEIVMPEDGWEERLGTAATAVLYQVCRVSKLSVQELSLFSYDFISHLFLLVERTRDAEDETFNYTVIKLIIALNEQFMISAPPKPSSHGHGSLPPPILPTIKGKQKQEKDLNLVLEVLKTGEGDSKTFAENIIFILNRANSTPDSLCTSLLILKILYLLFTTSGTQEYFYTNDLCVLVDVFIRELCDLDEDSEMLKHSFLRVLQPLLTNTQLRHHPYKRPQLRRVLNSLISNSTYREIDPTTRRLVERNLRGSWCDGLDDSSLGEGEVRGMYRKGSEGEKARKGSGMGWSSGMGMGRSADGSLEERLRGTSISSSNNGDSSEKTGYDGSGIAITRSADAVSEMNKLGGSTIKVNHRQHSHHLEQRRSASADHPPPVTVISEPRSTSPQSFQPYDPNESSPPPLPEKNNSLSPPLHSANRQRSTSLVTPSPLRPDVRSIYPNYTPASSTSYSSLTSLNSPTPPLDTPTITRRRKPPPPPSDSSSRPRTPNTTPSSFNTTPESSPRIKTTPSLLPAAPLRRAAPDPPKGGRNDKSGPSIIEPVVVIDKAACRKLESSGGGMARLKQALRKRGSNNDVSTVGGSE